MFTGIVEETGRVISAQERELIISASAVLEGMKQGGSMAINGVCLTVTEFDNVSFAADLMPETLRKTNLGLLHAGDKVNLERPMALGGQVGGHLIQGHVDNTGRLTSITQDGNAKLLRFEAPPRNYKIYRDEGVYRYRRH